MIRNQSGFTFLELLIAAVMVGMLAMLVSEFYVNRLVDYAHTNALIILQGNTRQALQNVMTDVKQAQSIETTNEWADAHGPSGNSYGWSSTSGSPSTLVLAEPTLDSSGNLQYVDLAHSVLQTNDVIYYVNSSNQTLYRRVLANPICLPSEGGIGLINCRERTTCPAASATSTCPADGDVIENVANLVVAYFDTSNNATVDIANSYSLSATLTQSLAEFGHTYTDSLTSRATLRNKP